ncbi:MAG: iron(III) transport system substrate-binding protein [Pseudonocardiales bacterium]|nr:iron(III) transport system substrate-binding protein [Pseudonocardiales bacterium]
MTYRSHYVRLTAVIGAVTCVALGAAACSSDKKTAAATGGGAGAIGKTVQEVCDLGAKEGSVTLRRGTDSDVFDKEIAPFKAKYPNIKINYVSMKPQDNVQRILASIQTGHTLDVDGTDFDLPSAEPLFQGKAVANVDWKSLGVPDDATINYNGLTLARTDVLLGGLVYDANKTKPEDLPNTWEELADSKYAGKFVVDTRGKQLSPLALVWGEQKALDWYKKLMSDAKPIGVQGATASVQKVTSGEAVFTTSAHNNETDQTNAGGGSVAIKYLDIVPAFTEYTYVLDKAPHPNAIRCLYAWRLSAEGEAQIKKYEFKTNETNPSGLPANAQLASDRTEEQGQLDAKVASAFAKLTK